MRAAMLSAAALFLAAHLVTLPPAVEDLDSLNFALGVEHFDVALHQPHPPGYPVFIALGKMSTAALRAAGASNPEVRGLAIWSALSGAVLVPLLFLLWAAVDGGTRRAALAAAIAAASPLCWFTALRPLSDMTGLAAAIAALAALARAWPGGPTPDASRPRWLVAAALIAGLGIGIRSQTAALTGPLLAGCVFLPWSRLSLAARLGAIAAFAAGVAAWGVPLLVASGGPGAYLVALGSQAGEDFSGVRMLWTQPTARGAAAAILDTFVRPWDSPLLAGVVLALAAAGILRLAIGHARALALTVVMFAPYLVFHLLFQESFTLRYALPVMLPVAFGAAAMIDLAPPVAASLVAAAIVAVSLTLAVPAGLAFGRTASPIVAALTVMEQAPLPVLGMHRRLFTESRRARAWMPTGAGRTLPSPRDLEWLELTGALRRPGVTAAWFLADPKRTDLALIDPASDIVRRLRWPFNGRTYVGGARPDALDLHRIERPGWLLERGWALTPETAGVAEREGWRPDRQPSVGWVRRRAGAATLEIGGRYLAAGDAGPVRIVVTADGRELLACEADPGFFLRFADLPAGALDGPEGYAKLSVQAGRPGGGAVPAPVLIEQFDLQDAGRPLFGYDDGWHEPEYNPATGVSWRWMSERATLRIQPTGRDIVLRVSGENPLRYVERAPELTLRVGGATVLRTRPDGDFTADVRLPADALAAAEGRVEFASTEMFVPGGAGGLGDQRHLALRIYTVAVIPAQP